MVQEQPVTATAMTDAIVELAQRHDPGRLHTMLESLTSTQLRTVVVTLATRAAGDPSPAPDLTSPAQICEVAIAAAAAQFCTTPEAVRSPARSREITDARSVAMAAARSSGLSLPAIGAEFDRDHTTVMHAVNRVADRPRLAAAAAQITDRIVTAQQQSATPQRAPLRLVTNSEPQAPRPTAVGAADESRLGRVSAAIEAAARTFGTTPEALRGPDRDRPVAEARAVAMTAARMTGMSLPKIAAEFDRHHTAVLQAVRRVEQIPPMRELAERIARDLPRDEATPTEQARARHLAQVPAEQPTGHQSPTRGQQHDRLAGTAVSSHLAAAPQR